MPRLHRAVFQFAAMVCIILQVGCGAAQLAMCAPHTKEDGTPIETWIECFGRPFSRGNITHSVFCLNDGADKPPVVLLHELTGLSPGTLAYAEELSKNFTVYVPLLFGEKGKFSLTKGLSAYWFEDSWSFSPVVNGAAPLTEALPL